MLTYSPRPATRAGDKALEVPFNDSRRCYDEHRSEIQVAIRRVLNSGKYVLGPEHYAFEANFAEYLGIRAVAGVANGTDALTLILAALVHDRDGPLCDGRILCAANAGGYAATAAERVGLTPTFVDIDESSHCISPTSLAQALEREPEEVVAVVVTHLYGRMAEIQQIAAICRSADVPLIEDCAQAVGASLLGRRAGTFGLASAFSFYPTKNLGALGDAGAVATDDLGFIEQIRRLRQYGWSAKYHQTHRGGINSRMDEVQAAVLNVRLAHLDDWNEQRRKINHQYRTAVSNCGLQVLSTDSESHAAHLAVAVTDNRDSLIEHLDSKSIANDIHYPVPDHLQVARTRYTNAEVARLPITERLAKQVLSLPLFPHLHPNEIGRVCDAITTFEVRRVGRI